MTTPQIPENPDKKQHKELAYETLEKLVKHVHEAIQGGRGFVVSAAIEGEKDPIQLAFTGGHVYALLKLVPLFNEQNYNLAAALNEALAAAEKMAKEREAAHKNDNTYIKQNEDGSISLQFNQ